MLNLLKKQLFKSNHYFGSFLDPKNWWCISAQFEKFEKIWGTVKGRTLKLKKMILKFHILWISFVYLLIIICTLHAKFKKTTCMWRYWCCKVGVKWLICRNQQQRPLLEISCIPLLSVIRLLDYIKFQALKLILVQKIWKNSVLL